jgi:hypothetical protein
VASSPLCDSIPVEIKCINVRRNKTIFKLLKKSTTCFGPFLGGHHQVEARISEKKLIYYNVDIKNGGTKSHFTMFGEVRSYIYAMWNLC